MAPSIDAKSDDQLSEATHRRINPGLVSERIKSLLAKNLASADCRKPSESGHKNRHLTKPAEITRTIGASMPVESESDDPN